MPLLPLRSPLGVHNLRHLASQSPGLSAKVLCSSAAQHLEKQVSRLRQELDALRQHQAHQQAALQQQQQQPHASRATEHQQHQQHAAEMQRLQELVRAKQAALAELQQRLVGAEARHKQVRGLGGALPSEGYSGQFLLGLAAAGEGYMPAGCTQR